MAAPNQTPEEIARDRIDEMLSAAGWVVQDNKAIDFNAAPGIAVREYQTDVGPADYVLFAERQAVGVIEAKPDTWGQKITTTEEQSQGYATATLKWVNNEHPLPFVYESTGVITRFTNGRDPNPRSREMFNFHRPGILAAWAAESHSLRTRLQDLPPLDPCGLWVCQVKAIETWRTPSATIAPVPSSRWRRARERRTPPSVPSIGCSSTPAQAACSF